MRERRNMGKRERGTDPDRRKERKDRGKGNRERECQVTFLPPPPHNVTFGESLALPS